MSDKDNYAMLYYSNLSYAQYKPSCMHYTVTYHHGVFCFLIAGGNSSQLIRCASHGSQISGIQAATIS